MKFEYWKSTADKMWYWHLKGRNGEIIAQSEGYTREASCVDAIALVKDAGDAPEVNLGVQ